MSSEFDLKDFRIDVVEESKTRPVVIDFWADWCGPCKVLGPTIEKLAKEAKGRWKLVKIDTEAHQEIASQFGIRSIPAVKMVFQGKIIGEFTGALPEHDIKKWLDQYLPPAPEVEDGIKLVHDALLLGDRATAFEKVKDLFIDSPENEEYRSLLGMLLLPTDVKEAQQIMAPLATQSKFSIEIEAIETISKLHALIAKEETLPTEGNHKAIEFFAQGLHAFEKNDFSTALDFFIQSIMYEKAFANELARKSCVALFKLLTENHPISKSKRRAFSMSLT